jgi:hypothetical protein
MTASHRTPLALILTAAALMAGAGSAGALMPVGTGTGTGTGIPPIPAPVASFTISPNPALISFQPVAAARALAVAPGATTVSGGGSVVTFDASASSDAHGIASYAWDLDGNGTFETSGSAARIETRRYYQSGAFTIRLRVTSTDGLSSTATETLNVHRAPKAKIDADRTTINVGGELKLESARSSGDPGLVRFVWERDGVPIITTSYAEAVPMRFSCAGHHTVTLVVTDSLGVSASATLAVTVRSRFPGSPADVSICGTSVNAAAR